MGKIKIISENKLRYIAGSKGFNLIYLEKDYFLTCLLYLLRDTKDLCFKGGTALNKIFLNHTRLSEDLDFTCWKNIRGIKIRTEQMLENEKGIFPRYNFENETVNFFRMKIFYKSFFSKTNSVVLDINKKASVILCPQMKRVQHFYDFLPKFEILTLNIKELLAEKIRTLVMRNQPRDYFDVYTILKRGYGIDFKLVEKKLKEADCEFEPERIFKNAQKIYSKWDTDINQLTNRPAKFMDVIKTLKKEFRYKKV
jgi:predicted nucleotidyltransferase component of viral defense system